MSPSTPVIVVDDDQHLTRYLPEAIGEFLRCDVIAIETLDQLDTEMVALNADPALPGAVILLDPGLPGICRFQTIPRVVKAYPRARVVQWTSNREVQVHSGALIDGAMASLEKSRTSPSEAAEVIEWAATDRRWCEPDQAQWFVELLECLEFHKEEIKDTVWKTTKLDRLPEKKTIRSYVERLLDLATGGDMPADDRWFSDLLTMLRPYWITPSLLRSKTALALHPTVREASAAVDKTPGAMGNDCTYISGRIMPSRAGRYAEPNRRDNAIIRALVREHNPCELREDEHDLSPEAFGS